MKCSQIYTQTTKLCPKCIYWGKKTLKIHDLSIYLKKKQTKTKSQNFREENKREKERKVKTAQRIIIVLNSLQDRETKREKEKRGR